MSSVPELDEKERMIKSDDPPSRLVTVPLTQQQQSQFLNYVPSLQVPQEFIPNDFFLPTFVITVACGVVSVSTLLFTIPAIICATLSWMKKRQGIQFHRSAKTFGRAALILDVVVLLWMLGWGILVVTYVTAAYYIFNVLEADDFGCGGDVHIETPFY